MKQLLGTLFVAGLFVAGANAQGPPLFRTFFDVEGSVGDAGSHRPGDHNLSYGNPVLPAGGGRLYIYGEFQEDDQTILSPNIDIEIDGGTITEAWNYNGPGQSLLDPNEIRWNAAAPNPLVNPGGSTVSFTSANLTRMGLKNGILADNFDIQHDNTRGFGETLLGYVDVEAPGAASVWIIVGLQGFAILGGGPDTLLYFGYGDPPGRAGNRGRTKIAEATVVPEPASLMLLGLGALTLRRRR